LPILFSLKADGTLGKSAPWTAIWTPMWIFDLFIILIASSQLFISEDVEMDENGEVIKREQIPLFGRVFGFLLVILFTLIQIFILMKLDGDISSWSWFAVFSPWFFYEVFSIILNVDKAFIHKIEPPAPIDEHSILKTMGGNHGNGDEENPGLSEEEIAFQRHTNELNHFKELTERLQSRIEIVDHILRLWLAIFLAVKLDRTVNWDWGLVLLPIWVYFFEKYCLVCIYRSWSKQIIKENDLRPAFSEYETDPVRQAKYQEFQVTEAAGTATCLGQCAPLFMALMLISRLDVSKFSVFLILLPIFLCLGCCCMIVFCGIVCIANTDVDEAETRLRQQHPYGMGGGEHTNGQAQAGEPTYNPPIFVVEEPLSPSSNLNTTTTQQAEYGSMGATNINYAPSATDGTSDRIKEESISPAGPVVTNIDPDID
jgi:hypothetical protein